MLAFSARRENGLTLIELVVVMAVLAVIVVPLLLTYQSYRTSLALTSSAEAVVNHARSAHIFAREARNQREWGIRSINSTQYAIFSSGTTESRNEQNYSLEPRVAFTEDFEVLFNIGTGETDREHIIELVNTSNSRAQVIVSEVGIVEVVRP